MADSSGSEVSSWTSSDAGPGEALPVSEINQQITASASQSDWRSCSPSNGSDITESPVSTWQDSCLPVLDSSLPSVAASAPSTTTDGTCWSAAGAVASCSDASSPLVWADCDSDGVLTSVQQQQQQAGNTTVNAQVPKSGRAFVPGRAARGNSPDGELSSRASSGQSSAGTASGVSQESAPEAYSSGVWNPAASTSSRGHVKALATDDKETLTPQMLKAIESTERWSCTTVRQDTPWLLPPSKNGSQKGDPNQWCPSQNSGTAVWESCRSNNGAGSSASAHHAPGSWSDRRASVPLDRSGTQWTASLSRDSPSWVENADRAGSSTALDVPPWNGSNNVNRIRSRTPGSLPASQGSAANFPNGEGNRSSPPGAPGATGTQAEWNTGGLKGFRVPDGRPAQPSWAESGQAHNWSHNDNFFGTAAPSRQLSQATGRGDFISSSVPWDQSTTQSGLAGSATASELSDWDQSSTLGTGSAAWPPSEGSGNHRNSKSTHREDSMPDWSASVPAVAAPRRGRYSVDAGMTGSWRNDSEIGDWTRCTSGGSIHRILPPGSKQSAINGAAPKVSGHSFSHQLPMRPHLMQKLLEMGFSKESAQKALIDNNMDLRQAIADLHRSSAGGPQSVVHAPRPLLPPADASASGGFSSSPLQMYPPGSQNTHHGNTQIGAAMTGKPFAHVPAGRQQPFATALPSKLPRQPPNGQYIPTSVSGWSSMGANQQAMQSLQYLINLGYIPPSALAKQTNNAVIEQMMGLLSAFQALQMQVTRCSSPQMAAHHLEQLDVIKQKLATLGQSLAEASQHRPHQAPDVMLSDELASLSLGQHQYMQQTQQGQSKLAQWKVPSDSDTGMLSQASRAPGTKPMTAGLSGATSADDVWSASTSSRPKLDANHNESQSVVDDLHEFIPGQMWAGSPGLTNDDGLRSSGSPLSIGGGDEASGWSSSFASISRSLSVPSAGGWSLGSNAGSTAAVPASRLEATHGSSGVSGNTDSHWSSAMPRASAAPGRPPPGLSNFSASAKSAVGYGRRSSTSACWSPSSGATGVNGGGGRSQWDAQSNQWVVLQNVPLHIDQARLKAMCGLYGAVTAFLPNLAAGTALVQYSSAHEAAAAQGSLHNRFIAQNTLQAQLVGDDEARSFVERAASHGASSAAGLATAAFSSWNAAGSVPTSGAAPSAWSSSSSASASAMPGLGNIVLGNLWQGGAGAGSEGGSGSAGGGSGVVGGSPYPTDY